jgi:hypothetical protein
VWGVNWIELAQIFVCGDYWYDQCILLAVSCEQISLPGNSSDTVLVLLNDQLDAQFLFLYVYFDSLHV